MLQAVGMPLLCGQSRNLSVPLENPEELAPVEPATLLAGKNIPAAVIGALLEPCPRGNHLI
jgi:hypothetical protein